MADRVKIRVCLYTGKGRLRKNNEDNYYLNGRYSDLSDIDHEKNISAEFTKDNALFAVCDGMGGIANGEVASFIACRELSSLYAFLETMPYADALQAWITQTNRLIVNTLDKGGCTLAMVYAENETVHISNIGDSRVYLFSDGKLSLLSKDHSKVQIMVDAGILTQKQAENHPQKNVITRYLGMREDLVGTCAPYHAPVRQASNQDLYLICSDGVSDMLCADEIESVFRQSQSLNECAENLYRAALEAGGKDNLTLIVLKFES